MTEKKQSASTKRTNLWFGSYFLVCSVVPVLSAHDQLNATEFTLLILRSLIDGFAVSVILFWLYARYMRKQINFEYIFLAGSALYYLFLSTSLSIHIDSNPLKAIILVLLLALPIMFRNLWESRSGAISDKVDPVSPS